MNRRSKWLPMIAAVAIVLPGCDSGTDSEANKRSAGAETKASTPAEKAALEKAKNADPRGR